MHFVCTHMYIRYPPGRDHPCHCPDLQVFVVYLAPACLHHSAFLESWNPVKQVSEQVHTTDIRVCTQYKLSMYWVHTGMYWVRTEYGLSTGLCPLLSDVTVLQLSLLPGTNSTLCILGMAQCCIGVYYAIAPYHLVLLCSGTYLLVMHLTIPAISIFPFGTQYI